MTRQTQSEKEILSQFLSSAEILRNQTRSLSAADLDASDEPGGWTIRQIVHHLADDGDVWSMCIKKAIATPGALVRFEGFPGNEAWADGLAFDQRKIGRSLDLILAHRGYVAEILEHFAGAWDRSVRIANAEGQVVREMTVRDMVEMLTDHTMEHSFTIDKAWAKKQMRDREDLE
jgi:hypothetical protein